MRRSAPAGPSGEAAPSSPDTISHSLFKMLVSPAAACRAASTPRDPEPAGGLPPPEGAPDTVPVFLRRVPAVTDETRRSPDAPAPNASETTACFGSLGRPMPTAGGRPEPQPSAGAASRRWNSDPNGAPSTPARDVVSPVRSATVSSMAGLESAAQSRARASTWTGAPSSYGYGQGGVPPSCASAKSRSEGAPPPMTSGLFALKPSSQLPSIRQGSRMSAELPPAAPARGLQTTPLAAGSRRPSVHHPTAASNHHGNNSSPGPTPIIKAGTRSQTSSSSVRFSQQDEQPLASAAVTEVFLPTIAVGGPPGSRRGSVERPVAASSRRGSVDVVAAPPRAPRKSLGEEVAEYAARKSKDGGRARCAQTVCPIWVAQHAFEYASTSPGTFRV